MKKSAGKQMSANFPFYLANSAPLLATHFGWIPGGLGLI